MSFDDLHIDKQVGQQLEIALPRRYAPERAEPVTAGELIAADAADRERARRELARIQEGLAVPHE